MEEENGEGVIVKGEWRETVEVGIRSDESFESESASFLLFYSFIIIILFDKNAAQTQLNCETDTSYPLDLIVPIRKVEGLRKLKL